MDKHDKGLWERTKDETAKAWNKTKEMGAKAWDKTIDAFSDDEDNNACKVEDKEHPMYNKKRECSKYKTK